MNYNVIRCTSVHKIVVTITNVTLIRVDTRYGNCFVFAIGDDTDVSAVKRLHKSYDYNIYHDKKIDVKDVVGISGDATTLTLECFDAIQIAVA